MWPFAFDIPSLWLALYLVTWALHAAFVGYVVAGTGYALARRATPLAEQVRDRLPFMLGCGITAGVAPLLFMQLLYQRRFYTANLLLGPRWLAIVPALIVGFYGLYLAKTSTKWRQRALAAGLGAFAFVAYSWSELHELAMQEPAWREFYAAGHRVYFAIEVPIRAATYLAGAVALFATISAWSVDEDARRRLARGAIAGIAIAGIGAGVLGARATHDVVAHGWLYLAIASAAITLAGWILVMRGARSGLAIATGATAAAVIAGAVVREAPRLAMIEPSDSARVAGGFPVFAITFVFGIAAIAWIVRTIRAA